ncbi:MAG: type II secretion system protein M [Steroidobacteraceae bacterium]|jgi:type II secretory pathway component PulM
MNAKLQAWFQELEPRERQMVLGGAIIVVLILIYSLLVPLHRQVNAAQVRFSERQRDLLWLQSVAPQLAALKSASASHGSESLVVLTDRIARGAGLASAIKGNQQSEDGSLSVHLEQAPFDAFTAWAGELVQQHGVQLVSASIEATSTPGLINATVTLRLR